MKKIISLYTMSLGLSVLCVWVLILLRHKLPEGLIELGFHLYSEFSMAVVCITGGWLLLEDKPMALATTLAGQAMAGYSALNTAGYHAQHNNDAFMFLFIGLFILSLLCILILYNMLGSEDLDKRTSSFL